MVGLGPLQRGPPPDAAAAAGPGLSSPRGRELLLSRATPGLPGVLGRRAEVLHDAGEQQLVQESGVQLKQGM